MPESRGSGAVKPKMDDMASCVKQHCVSHGTGCPDKSVVQGEPREVIARKTGLRLLRGLGLTIGWGQWRDSSGFRESEMGHPLDNQGATLAIATQCSS